MAAKKLRRIGVLTSGGDAPGMNAAVRAVVRKAIHLGLEVVGVRRGYSGLHRGDFIDMTARSVSNIIQRGGTILKTDRSREFQEPSGRAKAARALASHGVEGLVVIGGDGSFRGAQLLEAEHGVAVMGVPGTIDNDIYGTDSTIGFDTAVNNAVEAIDKIRDTAAAHGRLFLVEVMGRKSGFIALATGLAAGAETIVIPEEPVDIDKICSSLLAGLERGKASSVVVVAEGQKAGAVFQIAEKITQTGGPECKVVVLGHLQRGGNPTARDRILASVLGAAAVDALVAGKSGFMAGMLAGKVALCPLADASTKKPTIDRDALELAKVLAI
jgi:6-phosphofructokinase 1